MTLRREDVKGFGTEVIGDNSGSIKYVIGNAPWMIMIMCLLCKC